MTYKKNRRLCHVCGSTLVQAYDRVIDIATDEGFGILRCTGCGIGHTNPVPENLKKYYDGTYYGNRHGFTERYCIKRRAGVVFSALKNIKGNRLLDIGCGDGSFIRYMKHKGFHVAGTEINPDQSLFHGLAVSNGIQKLDANESFDCITMWHTLEHMPDTACMLKHVHRLVAAEGKLIVAVPNNDSFQSILFKNRWLHLDVPRHLCHFDARSLGCCLESSGFSVEGIIYQEFEYDLLGWVQSALNSVFTTKNLFFDFLRGRHKYPLGLMNLINIFVGYVMTGLFIPAVIIEKIMNKSGTVIVTAGKSIK